MTDFEKMVQQLWDENECKKLMSRYEYYAFGREWDKVPALFADREDVWIDCEGFGVFDGPKGIETFFVDWHNSMEDSGEGMLTLHTLTTELVEVSGDGKTARGMWISPGTETRFKLGTKEHEAYWIWGLYAVDFIREPDGSWKMWHFRIPHLLLCDYHNSWVDIDKTAWTLETGVGNNGRPSADRPSTFKGTFYSRKKAQDNFFTPPPPHFTDADLGDLWTLK